ncbi:50S ribosomal protein L31 [Candidatus Poribacteria bacterium]|nr:50S ribosomal protein L31 [Candidatus Poribacteria bacterium]MYA55603.1 50S ribosomal protein L31 [Candidatus Poribacteria bacterium]
MKAGIHPELVECVVTCVCGAVHKTLATQPTMRVDVCGECHPFYTGQQARFIDTAGRVESFRRRYGLTETGHTQIV